MHLLSAQAGAIQQEGEAIDLGQSPAPLLILSAADSELAAFAGAIDAQGADDVRLANTMRLSHNYSIDLWLDDTAQHAKLIVVRVLGGRAYWTYGVDQLTALCADRGIELALLPGDANPDPDLKSRSTINGEIYDQLHQAFIAGGAQNLSSLLTFLRHRAKGETAELPAPQPAPNAAIWHERQLVSNLHEITFDPAAKYAPIIAYRALMDGGNLRPIERMARAAHKEGLTPLILLVTSLKQSEPVQFAQKLFARFDPQVILNATGFALGINDLSDEDNPFAYTDAPILQLVQAGRAEEVWQEDIQGLNAKDLAMQIVLPELDGRAGNILIAHKAQNIWHDASECPLSVNEPHVPGIDAAAKLAKNWVTLRQKQVAERKVGIVLANYPIRDGRLANGVGYDAPASTLNILQFLQEEGYALDHLPESGNALVEMLQNGPTNAAPKRGTSQATITLENYRKLYEILPETLKNSIEERWGTPESDPFFREDHFELPAIQFGHAAILIQPARGYDLDEEAIYHDPDLVPPHGYLAGYFWLTHQFAADALIHNGKHGNLEWLPGKAVALSDECYPHMLWAQLPHFYPFIVNDPGEGTQAKRRTGAVIIDHLTPPLTRAETHGPLKDLEALADEFYNASGMDQRRIKDLKQRIFDLCADTGLAADMGLGDAQDDDALQTIDTFLCELKEAQIRDGLHILGQAPEGRLKHDLLVALTRVPRGSERDQDHSIIRAMADDLGLGFDPLSAELGKEWTGPRPAILQSQLDESWRHTGHTVERLEQLAFALVAGEIDAKADWTATRAILDTIQSDIAPKLDQSGALEKANLLRGLDGKFVPPGPSGAPTRGRLDVLPTGRNFYSLDNRAVPTQTAWELGVKSAENLVTRHFQDHGLYLKSIVLSVWGTANMRTGGDDIAQALALIGAKPKWDFGSTRVSGYEIIPLAKMNRPRVDVTLRISGFFRDAFPAQIELFDRAIRAIGALDEPEDLNPIAARMRSDALELMQRGRDEDAAAMEAGYRIFGSKPGSYGAGLQGIMDSGRWNELGDIAETFINWGQYAYGTKANGTVARGALINRLKNIDAVVHNQDNREHDLLDSDDYYQFEGGLSATAKHLQGVAPANYHNDHSRPERPVAKTLEEEIAKVMRSRVVNPKWINGVMRHGYKGAFEIIATTDYMFAFAATTGAVKSHHFDLAFEAFVLNDEVRDFIQANNKYGYDELIDKFNEAVRRGFWSPKRNSTYAFLDGGNE
ncbi:cobaltochelatase subunit CobN [Maritalea mediterranea]|uniref:Cobaltochelatase subunit CobN n=1 Tax=Maritalea mediterranea TaxID=2909667 RepID=A0ABS9E666_9HYPH|nr:cobaltochelatase subunit CobN [Maritalea mediterranea]MCF4097394.1 cobaltochelatase subunit CobN [Maritalea mediterranea]